MNRDGAGQEPPEPESEEEDFAPTPFDGPYFLPAVLFGLAAWFGYDGFLNDDASMQRWWWFNQGGAVLWAALGAWFLYKARRERA